MHAKQLCCSPKVSNSLTPVMQPPKCPVGISQTCGLQPHSHFNQLFIGRVSQENQEDYVLKSKECKFLLCNNSSSSYGHCCSYRALLLVILNLHPLSLAQPGKRLSGIQSGNSTPSAKERVPKTQLCAVHSEKQKNTAAKNIEH